MDVRLLVVIYLMISIVSVAVASPYRSRSRNKNSAPTYDQKQTGEYNIQLHLKDFEVVALLSDSAFGELGDYDYNYDYSEITLKPGQSHTSTTTAIESIQSSTIKPSQKPETVLPPTATTSYPSESSTSTFQSTLTELSTQKTFPTVAVAEKLTSAQHIQIESSTQTAALPASTSRLETDLENVNVTKEEINTKHSTVKTEIIVKPVENLTIVDNEKPAMPEENIPVVIHRKCANGFTRDKLGRCRRVRRPAPQFSFGISRLATLASKLRHGTNDSQTASDPLLESIEE